MKLVIDEGNWSMHKRLILSTLILSLVACTEPETNKTEQQKNQFTSTENKSNYQGLTFEDIPNQDTTYETIEANNIDENEILMNALQTELLKNKFELFESESGKTWSENDCNLNKIIKVKGEGLRVYTAESKQGIGPKKNYFPDFTLLVFGFDDEQQAKQHFKTLASAVNSQGFCNGKAPEKIVRNGSEIFYFATRAEMFRGYIEQYAEFIQDYKEADIAQ